jgi:hypothetical protein
VEPCAKNCQEGGALSQPGCDGNLRRLICPLRAGCCAEEWAQKSRAGCACRSETANRQAEPDLLLASQGRNVCAGAPSLALRVSGDGAECEAPRWEYQETGKKYVNCIEGVLRKHLYRNDLRRFLDPFRREMRNWKSCITGRLEVCLTRESELASDWQVTARVNHGTCVHTRSSGEVNQRKSPKNRARIGRIRGRFSRCQSPV